MSQPDFILIPTQLLEDDGLQPLDRILYGYVYLYASTGNKKCIASNTHLAELTHVQAGSVGNALARLEGCGYVKRLYADEKRKRRLEIVPLLTFGGPKRYPHVPSRVTSNDETSHIKSLNHVPSNDEHIEKRKRNREGSFFNKIVDKAEFIKQYRELKAQGWKAFFGSDPVYVTRDNDLVVKIHSGDLKGYSASLKDISFVR